MCPAPPPGHTREVVGTHYRSAPALPSLTPHARTSHYVLQDKLSPSLTLHPSLARLDRVLLTDSGQPTVFLTTTTTMSEPPTLKMQASTTLRLPGVTQHLSGDTES